MSDVQGVLIDVERLPAPLRLAVGDQLLDDLSLRVDGAELRDLVASVGDDDPLALAGSNDVCAQILLEHLDADRMGHRALLSDCRCQF